MAKRNTFIRLSEQENLVFSHPQPSDSGRYRLGVQIIYFQGNLSSVPFSYHALRGNIYLPVVVLFFD
nr:hypothetical protein [secondary endosymbiont of Ctenarytaina eucalypti]